MIPAALAQPLLLIGRERGLPSVQVHDLTLDGNNVLWVAGPNGLAKVDDQRIRCIGRRDGLRSHGLRCVATGPDGRVWVGGDGGVDVLDRDGRLEDNAEPWRFGVVEKLCVRDDYVLAAASGGIRVWRPDTGWDVDRPMLEGTYVNQLVPTASGSIWAAGPQIGLRISGPNAWSEPTDDQWRMLGAISAIVPSTNGNVFVGGSNGAGEFTEAGEHIRTVFFNGEQHGTVSALWCFGDELWVGTDGQLRVGSVDSQGWQINSTVSDQLLVKAIVGDVHGTIWCATDSDGVAKITPARRAITRPVFPELAATLCITADPRQRNKDRTIGDEAGLQRSVNKAKRYIIGGNSGAWEIEVDSGVSRNEEPLFPNLKVWDILRRADGTIWAATQSGLHIRDSQDNVRHLGGDHAIVASPNRFLHEYQGWVVLGTINGVVAIDGRQNDLSFVQSWGDSHGQAIGYAYCVMEHDGSLFVGTLGRGLWRRDEEDFVQILSDGLIATGNTPAVVRGEGCMLISQDDRLIRLDDDGTSRVLTSSDEAVMGWAMTFDSHNRLWVGSPTGLKSFDIETGELLCDILVWMGRSGWEFTTSRSLVAGDNGMLLCGLNSGLALVETDVLQTLSVPPIVGLDAVRWTAANPTVRDSIETDDRAIFNVPVYRVDRGPWTVEIDVNARTLVDDGTTTFRFLLDGFDVDWSPRSRFAATRYSSLPEGHYRLKSQAHSPLSGWGESVVVVEIEVQPSMWRESDDPRHLVALLEDRVRISRDLHDNVVQRLFATGMELTALGRAVSPEQASRLFRVIDELDGTITEVRRAVFALGSDEVGRPRSLRKTVLEIAARAEELGGLAVEATVDAQVDSKLSARIGNEVLSVVREAMSNVVRHAHAKHAYLSVEIVSNPDSLLIVVSDDGVGIGEASSIGNGLGNLRSRAVSIGGSLEISSSSETGTRLEWLVPLSEL
jgi:signal transduction histidine kinase/ligand-binding sensor domain-containing protein